MSEQEKLEAAIGSVFDTHKFVRVNDEHVNAFIADIAAAVIDHTKARQFTVVEPAGTGRPDGPVYVDGVQFTRVPCDKGNSELMPIRLPCPECGALHIDAGEWATKPHHTHACQECGNVWRPAVVNTVGVRFLPGFKNEDNSHE